MIVLIVMTNRVVHSMYELAVGDERPPYDANALSRYCHLWSRWREAESFITKHRLMYPLKDDAGQPKCFQPWPQVSIANRLAQQLTRLEQEFGMTPSARSRLMLATPAKQYPENSIMRLVKGEVGNAIYMAVKTDAAGNLEPTKKKRYFENKE